MPNRRRRDRHDDLVQPLRPAAVGAFLYRRVLGVEPTEAGYRKFKFAPVVGGGITRAEGMVGTPYGVIKAAWKIADGEMTMTVAVPVGTECTACCRAGKKRCLAAGIYRYGKGVKTYCVNKLHLYTKKE